MYFKGIYDLIMSDTYQRVREVCFGAMDAEAFALMRRRFPEDGPPICGGGGSHWPDPRYGRDARRALAGDAAGHLLCQLGDA